MADLAGGIDNAAIVAELEGEVRKLRASGAVSHAYEQELSEAFRRLVPGRSSDEELARALLVADEASYIQGEIPIQSARRSVVAVKRLLRKSMAWYMNFIADQVQEMAKANGRVDKILASRLDELDTRSPARLPDEVIAHLDRSATPDLTPWASMVIGSLQGRNGRVAHMEAGQGTLVSHLVQAGVDAYGVEPRGDLADAARSAGLDVWPDDVFEHLHQVGEASLSALVLSGVVDREVPGKLWELLNLSLLALAPGSPMVVISSTPSAWVAGRLGVAADLAPGRPLQAASWRVLMEAAGFTGIELKGVPGGGETDKGDLTLGADWLYSGPQTVALVGVKGS